MGRKNIVADRETQPGTPLLRAKEWLKDAGLLLPANAVPAILEQHLHAAAPGAAR